MAPPAVLLAGSVPGAFGHAAFLESTPAPGTRLESSPRVITLEYTEPLIERLTSVTVTHVPSGRRVPATLQVVDGRALAARPDADLRTGAYRVEWHTVSTEDGHALEGSFGFGVRADAIGGTHSAERSPLARGGWVRIAFRGLFYVALVFFAGGLIAAAILSTGRGPAEWLLPPAAAQDACLRDAAAIWWARTVDAGWLAIGAGSAAVLAEGADAAGSLSVEGMTQFLLSSVAGVARVITVVALLSAVLLATRHRSAAVMALCAGFLGIALGGHANSATQPQIAVATDWLHLLAGSAWLGGITQLAAAWWHVGRARPPETRRAVMRHVLVGFGRFALPAFAIVVMSGLLNALLQLGSLEAAWTTAYGLVLTVKIALVALIGLISYVLVFRLRPRLLAAPATTPLALLERRHWSLLRSEPIIGLAVVAAASALVAFPLPPRQAADAARAQAAAVPACDPCSQRPAGPDELAVADNAGSFIVAGWIRAAGAATTAEVRVLGRNAAPADVDARVQGARQRSCGRGCWNVVLAGQPASLEVDVSERGRRYTARLPTRWEPGTEREARRLLARAERQMRSLRSVREHERITSGPGSLAVTRYALEAPDRMTYAVAGGGRVVVVGATEWRRVAELRRWQRGRYGAGMPFKMRSWFRWSPYADSVRLLRRWATADGPQAELAVFDRATPVWFRMRLDLRTNRVQGVRMIADGHFMTTRYFDFNRPVSIEPPDSD